MTAAETAPSPAPGANLRRCAECGDMFLAKREHARFCGDACRKASNNRNTARGGPVMPILQAWHATRHAKPGTREADINRYARRELTAMARQFNGEDAEAGRLASVIEAVGALMDSQSIYADRTRR